MGPNPMGERPWALPRLGRSLAGPHALIHSFEDEVALAFMRMRSLAWPRALIWNPISGCLLNPD